MAATAICVPAFARLRRTGGRPARSPNAVTDTTHCGLQTRSPPAIPAPSGTGFEPHAVSQFLYSCRRCLCRRAERDDERCDTRAHRLDIRGVLGNRLAAQVMWRGPVQPKMPAFDEHVRGTATRASGALTTARIVARTQQDTGGLTATRDDAIDHREFAQFREAGSPSMALRSPSGTFGSQ